MSRQPPPLMRKMGRTHWDPGAGLWVRPPAARQEQNLVNDQGMPVPEAMAAVGRTYWDRGQGRWTTPPEGFKVGGRSRYDPQVQEMLASGVDLGSLKV